MSSTRSGKAACCVGYKVRNYSHGTYLSVLNRFLLLINACVRADFGNLFVDIRWECLEPVPAVQGNRNLKYAGLWKSWPLEMERMQTSQAC